MAEALEHLFHADGWLVRTLPRLAFHPASLTRDYLAGRRVSQTPPFRLFLVVILLFFFTGGVRDFVKPSTVRWVQADAPTKAHTDIRFGDLAGGDQLAAWLKPRLTYVVAHPRELAMGMADWMHRMPVATLALSLLFVFQRRFFVFDHAIFSMHSLSFMGLLATAITLTSMVPLLAGLVGWMIFIAPIHLVVHMRGAYSTSIPGTLARMAGLFVISLIAVAVLLAGVFVVELNALGVGES